MTGRVRTYDAIIKGHNVPKPGVPESFKVLMKELQSLCLDIRVLDAQGVEVELKDDEEETYTRDASDYDDYDAFAAEDEYAAAGGFAVGEMDEEGTVIEADDFEESDELFLDGDED